MRFNFAVTYAALWTVVAIQGFLILALVRAISQLRKSTLQGVVVEERRPVVGIVGPAFQGSDPRSGRIVSSTAFAHVGGVALFLSPGCSACKRLAAGLKHAFGTRLPPVIVFCRGSEGECMDIAGRLSAEIPLLLDSTEDTAARYGVSGYPTAIILDQGNKVRGYGHPQDVADLEELVSLNRNKLAPEPAPGLAFAVSEE